MARTMSLLAMEVLRRQQPEDLSQLPTTLITSSPPPSGSNSESKTLAETTSPSKTSSASSRTLVVPATNSEPEVTITIISPLDIKWHQQNAEHIEKYPAFWDDPMRINPAASYINMFCNPNNLVFDVNGEGCVAFFRIANGTRAMISAVAWGKKAAHIHTARNKMGEIALTLLRVQRLEAITQEDNINARESMIAFGMHYCGRLPGGLCYNGVPKDCVWYEVDRSDYNMEPL